MAALLLGIDVGSSFVKATIVDAGTGGALVSAQSPPVEMPIHSAKPGWAEQHPSQWWQHTVLAIRHCLAHPQVNAAAIKAIGIAYQMHGLVAVDEQGEPVRPAIIWCDSRAVSIGEQASMSLGVDYCLQRLLNSPGNFTASKLNWVYQHEPLLFERIHKIMLPGDYIAFRLSGAMQTTAPGLSEAILWDFKDNTVSDAVLAQFKIPRHLLPEVVPVFATQAAVSSAAATETGLAVGTRISYRAGDQPNNAFSLKVLQPGETAATAGTSGVIYAVTEHNRYDHQSRVNTFMHVNSTAGAPRNGVLLCLNGAGILNSWLRKVLASGLSYDQMNAQAAQAGIGSEGLCILPFGNGTERMLNNKAVGASILGLDFNRHHMAQIFRAAQEAVAFGMGYGFSILRGMNLNTQIVRAGQANMFLSSVFSEAFVNTLNLPLELFDTNGAQGAALGAGVGVGIFTDETEALQSLQRLACIEPQPALVAEYAEAYARWLAYLEKPVSA